MTKDEGPMTNDEFASQHRIVMIGSIVSRNTDASLAQILSSQFDVRVDAFVIRN